MKKIKDMHFIDDVTGISLFYPAVPKRGKEYVCDTLSTRWIGQGPKVDLFEDKFKKYIKSSHHPVAVGAGTDALHLAYTLCDMHPGDEVIAPVFTCTATNIPFLHMGVNIRFADIQLDTMNMDPKHVESLMTSKTKAIVCVHYGGLPCDMTELRVIADKWNVPIIEDAAHALGAFYKGTPIGSLSEYTMFSFQAIKHMTTGDGGMLMVQDDAIVDKAKRVRWFGIDRNAKQDGTWKNDITEPGFKYQMTDISASLGLASLEEVEGNLLCRQSLLKKYEECLDAIPGVHFLSGNRDDRVHAAWLCTILSDDIADIQSRLYEYKIESNQVHFRNDRYTIFKDHIKGCEFPNMDELEDKYLVLPLHQELSESDVERICGIIKKG